MQVKLSESASVYCTDPYNVSSVAVSGANVTYIGQTSLWEPLPSDFRGSITFTATNLFGLSSSCTVSVTTFTTQTAWGTDGNRMDITGGSKNTTAVQQEPLPIYYVNSTYGIAGPEMQLNFSNDRLFENYYGNSDEIVFEVTVAPQVNGLVYIDQQSGDVIISPKGSHAGAGTTNYKAELRGRDSKGAVAVVNRWSFAVEARPAFKVLNYTRLTSGADIVTDMPLRAQSPFAAGEPFRVAVVSLTEVVHADPARCTFTLLGNASSAGLFINPATGAIQGLIDAAGLYQMTLVARTQYGAEAVVEDVLLDVRTKDVAVAAYGPNGKGCGDHGQATDAAGAGFDGSFTCKCDSRFEGDNCETEVNDSSIVIALFSVIGMVMLVASIVVISKFRTYRRMNKAHDFGENLEDVPTYGMRSSISSSSSAFEVVMPREIARRKVTLVEQIGSGNFGSVWKAKLLLDSVPGGITVAAKVLNSDSDEGRNELYSEAMVTAQLSGDNGHKNVVSLLGVVTAGNPPMLLVSYCENGALVTQLRSRSARHDSFSLPAKLHFGLQICKGMAYLQRKKVVHRDLAARNVLLDVDWACKVADFGLSRETQQEGSSKDYYRSSEGMFAVRWTAPEALEDLKFSEASDVWALGVTMAEILQDGAEPYAELPSAQNVIFYVQKGERIKQHELGCSDDVYAILERCWNDSPARRPKFTDLIGDFSGILEEMLDADADGPVSTLHPNIRARALEETLDAWQGSTRPRRSSTGERVFDISAAPVHAQGRAEGSLQDFPAGPVSPFYNGFLEPCATHNGNGYITQPSASGSTELPSQVLYAVTTASSGNISMFRKDSRRRAGHGTAIQHRSSADLEVVQNPAFDNAYNRLSVTSTEGNTYNRLSVASSAGASTHSGSGSGSGWVIQSNDASYARLSAFSAGGQAKKSPASTNGVSSNAYHHLAPTGRVPQLMETAASTEAMQSDAVEGYLDVGDEPVGSAAYEFASADGAVVGDTDAGKPVTTATTSPPAGGGPNVYEFASTSCIGAGGTGDARTHEGGVANNAVESAAYEFASADGAVIGDVDAGNPLATTTTSPAVTAGSSGYECPVLQHELPGDTGDTRNLAAATSTAAAADSSGYEFVSADGTVTGDGSTTTTGSVATTMC